MEIQLIVNYLFLTSEKNSLQKMSTPSVLNAMYALQLTKMFHFM